MLKFDNGKNYPQHFFKKVSNSRKSWTFMESNFPNHIADCKTYDNAYKCKVLSFTRKQEMPGCY